MPALKMRVRAPAVQGVERVISVAFEEATAFPGAFMLQIDLIGWELLQDAEEISAVYLSEDGKTCMLTQESVRQALESAASHTLEVFVSDAHGGSSILTKEAADVDSLCSDETCFSIEAERNLASPSGAFSAMISRFADEPDELNCPGVMAACSSIKAERANGTSSGALSAKVMTSDLLILGIEAYESASARGDATSRSADCQVDLLDYRRVFCIGHVMLVASNRQHDDASNEVESSSVPACAKFTLLNDGEKAWPPTARITIFSGDHFGLPVFPLPRVEVGATTEVRMDLSLPNLDPACGTQRSIWVIKDIETGQTFGPLLTFEVEAEWQLL